jgi:hypothetical protein
MAAAVAPGAAQMPPTMQFNPLGIPANNGLAAALAAKTAAAATGLGQGAMTRRNSAYGSRVGPLF